ncbi:MAG: hypothetical protein QM820_13305 [Minicystis sp.]
MSTIPPGGNGGSGGSGGDGSCGPFARCDGVCVDLAADPKHCGDCDNACPGASLCIAGGCACAGGTGSLCGGACVDTTKDPYNCGACGHACDLQAGFACSGGVCAFACGFGLLDCNADTSDGCEVDTTSDPKNCGVCGHVCEGGAGCSAGKCDPVSIADAPDGVLDIAVDEQRVFWTTPSGKLFAAPLAGGSVTTLDSGGNPVAIALDEGNVYATDHNAGAILKVAKDGTGASVLTSAPGVTAIATSGSRVYFAGNAGQAWSLKSVLTNGGAPDMLASGAGGINGLAVDPGGIYLAADGPTGGAILTVPLGGGTAQTLAGDQSSPRRIVAQNGEIYWVEYGNCQVHRMSLNGGGPATLFAGNLGDNACTNIAVDATDVYAAGFIGLMRVPIAGGPLEILALAQTIGVAVSKDHVFFGQGGALVKMEK